MDTSFNASLQYFTAFFNLCFCEGFRSFRMELDLEMAKNRFNSDCEMAHEIVIVFVSR